MIAKIYKYTFTPWELLTITVPEQSTVLSFQAQRNHLALWVMLPANAPSTEERTFKVLATGEAFDDTNLLYIDTTQQGDLVWHCFEIIK